MRALNLPDEACLLKAFAGRDKKPRSDKKHQGTLLFTAVIIALVGLFLLTNSTLTGYFSYRAANLTNVTVNVRVNQSAIITLADYNLSNLTALRVSGEAQGEYRIELESNGVRYLVSQSQSEEGNLITGMVIGQFNETNLSGPPEEETPNIVVNETTTALEPDNETEPAMINGTELPVNETNISENETITTAETAHNQTFNVTTNHTALNITPNNQTETNVTDIIEGINVTVNTTEITISVPLNTTNQTLNISSNHTINTTPPLNQTIDETIINVTTNQTASENATINETELNQTALIPEPPAHTFIMDCLETCSLPPLSNARLIITTNQPLIITTLSVSMFTPEQDQNITLTSVPDITLELGESITLDGTKHFAGENVYDITTVPLATQVKGSFITITANQSGTYTAQLYAVGERLERSNTFTITITKATNQTLILTRQLPARVGESVKWEVNIPQQAQEQITIELPELASNITIITAQQELPALTEWLTRESRSLTITKANQTNHTVRYQTPAPEAYEELLSSTRKRVTISSELHYENVQASMTLPLQAPKEAITLTWLEEGTRVTPTYEDNDGNGLIEAITWTIPHLSNQTFEVSITILNVQSYPQVGSTWTVRFNTTGEANLSISAINGTTYGEGLPDDLTPLSLKCANQSTNFTLEGNNASTGLYNCNTTSTWTVQVNTLGKHYQAFTFGSMTVYARNTAYNYSSGILTAYEKTNAAQPANPYTYDSEATSTDYQNITKSDDSRWTTSGSGAGNYASQIYIWNTNGKNVSTLNVSWEGYGTRTASYVTYLKLYNFSGSSWVQYDSKDFTSSTDAPLNALLSSGISHFINSTTGEVAVLVTSQLLAMGGFTVTDYIELEFNQKPIIQSARIDPSMPTTTTTLEGLCKASDGDGETLAYSWQWYLNDTLNFTGHEAFYDYFCQQESANVSTACGGLATGTYAWDGTWWMPTTDYSKSFDRDYSTASIPASGATAHVYMNYSKPSGATIKSKWYAKTSGTSGNSYNITLPLSCWERNPLQLRYEGHTSANYANLTCYNSTHWVNLAYNTDPSFMEERMFWSIAATAHPENTEVNVNSIGTSYLHDNDEWIFSCLAYDGTDNATNWVNSSTAVVHNDVVCGETITESRTLQADLTNCASGGIIIGANDVTLDCNGFTIDGDNVDDNGVGVYATGRTNTTIKNCIIKEFSRGIELASDTTGTVYNNTIHHNYDHGIYLNADDAGTITVENNTIYRIANGGASGGKGIWIYQTQDAIIRYNNIYDNDYQGIFINGLATGTRNAKNNLIAFNTVHNINTSTGAGIVSKHARLNIIANNTIYDAEQYGIRLETTNETDVFNNTIYEVSRATDRGIDITTSTDNTITFNTIYDLDSNGYGIDVDSNSNTISDNILTNNTRGIYVNGGDYNAFSNNLIRNSTQAGLYIDATSTYNTFNGEKIYNCTYSGLQIHDSHNNTFANMEIIDNARTAGQYYNIYLQGTSSGNYIHHSTINHAHATIGIRARDDVTGNIIADMDITDDTAAQDLNLNMDSTAYSLTLLNVTMADLDYDGGTLYRAYHLDVHVQNSSANLQNANVSITNSSGTFETYALTDGSGNTPQLNFTHYKQNGSSSIHYYNNYTINVTAYRHITQATTRNFTTNHNLIFTLVYRNSIPTLSALTINSTNGGNQSSQDLWCKATISDNDNDKLNVSVRWYKNGALNQTLFYNNSYSSSYAFAQSLLSGNTTKEQNWLCSMRLDDGANTSEWVNSSSLTVLNTPPVEETSRISPTSPYTTDTLLGYCNATDADSDDVYYSWKWYKDGSVLSEGNQEQGGLCYQETANESSASDGSCSLQFGGSYSAGGVWNSLYRFYDGIWSTYTNTPISYGYINVTYEKPNGADQSSIWQIKYASPFSSVVYANHTIPTDCWDYNSSYLHLQYQIDMPTSYKANISCYNGTQWVNISTFASMWGDVYEDAMWWNITGEENPQGLEINVNNVSSSSTRQTEEWILSCLANDGDDNSNWMNSTLVTITNRIPNTPTVTINSTDGTDQTLEDLWCKATISDNDADKLNVSVRWYKNGALNQTRYYNNSYSSSYAFAQSLLDGNTTKGDQWKCSMRLDDSFDTSQWANSSTLTIQNDQPTLLTPTIVPATAYTNDTLKGSCQANDDDGDTQTFYWRWYKNTALNLSGSSAGHTQGASHNIVNQSSLNTTKTDQWILSCIAYDGEEYATAWKNSTTTTIQNRVPNMASPRIAPTNATTNDDLTGYCNATDIDEDTVSYYWKWYLNGALNETGTPVPITSIIMEDDTEDAAEYTGMCANPTYAYDEDIDTYAYVNSPDSSCYIYVNYTAPSFISSVISQLTTSRSIGDQFTYRCYNYSSGTFGQYGARTSGTGISTANFTIPPDCLQGATVRLQIKAQTAMGDPKIYEEKIWWNQTIVENYQEGLEHNVYNITSAWTAKNQAWTLSCLANDGTGNATAWVNVTETIDNGVPYLQAVAINSTDGTNQSDQDLWCSATLQDYDADTLDVTVRWYKNAVLQQTAFYNNSYGATTLFNASLPASNTLKGDNWSCQVRTDDATNMSEWYSSVNLTVINTGPIMTLPRISPTTPNTLEDLIGYCNATDDDGDSLTTWWKWFVDGSLNLTGSASGVTEGIEKNVANISSSWTSYGQVWNLSCLAGDGTMNATAWVNASVTIINNAPNNPTVSINSTDGTNETSQDLHCLATITDPEGDTLDASVRWYKNAALNRTDSYTSQANGTALDAPLLWGNTSKGENWSCSLQLFDGVDTSPWANSTNLTILNNQPALQTPTILPSTAYTNDTLLGSCQANDDDEDAQTFYWRWYKNTALNLSGKVTGLTQGIPHNIVNQSSLNTTTGESWILSCIAYDGEENATAWVNSSAKTIDNSPPVMASPRIDPSTSYTIDNLTGYCNATDVDDDMVSYYWKWYKDGTLNATNYPPEYTQTEDDTEDAADYDSYCTNPTNAYNEIWTDYAQPLGPWTVCVIDINYTKPSGLASAINEISAGHDGPQGGRVNYDCYNYSSGFYANLGSRITRINASMPDECLTGSTIRMRYRISATVGTGYLYEEKMWWNTSDSTYHPEGVEQNVANISNAWTTKNEEWTLSCLANDGSSPALAWVNASVTIQNTIPGTPTPIFPVTDTTDRYPNFNWSTITDADGDTITYDFNLTAPSGLECAGFNDADLTQSNRTSAVELCTLEDYSSSQFSWRSRACDDQDCSNYMAWQPFNVTGVINITLSVPTVTFGEQQRLQLLDTLGGSPPPFKIRNDGNVRININLSAQDLLFELYPALNHSSFQFAANISESGAFNTTGSALNWLNVSFVQQKLIDRLLYLPTQDEAETEIRIYTPNLEPPGPKKSTLIFNATSSRPS